MPLDYLALVAMRLALLSPLKLLQLDVASCQATAPNLCTDKRWSHTLYYFYGGKFSLLYLDFDLRGKL